jgi:hypothetical protein
MMILAIAATTAFLIVPLALANLNRAAAAIALGRSGAH